MPKSRSTGEVEFQGMVIVWLNSELKRRPGIPLELVTQETSDSDKKRNDIVIWRKRASHDAFLTIELKTPETPITDPILLQDACSKAQRWDAPLFAIWNMQSAEIYRTPEGHDLPTPSDRLYQFPFDRRVSNVEDWLKDDVQKRLQKRSIEILLKGWEIYSEGSAGLPIDASVFVDRLSKRIFDLRNEVAPELGSLAASNRKLRLRLRHIAAAQGFAGFVDDIVEAIAGQYCYRLVGQILFYFALRRAFTNLRVLTVEKGKPVIDGLQPYWEEVRKFDYEALYSPNELDGTVPLNENAERLLRGLVDDFNLYDWNSLKVDVLGAIFEQLIPKEEQLLLGQFYTPARVADLLLAMTIDGEKPRILDPGCGSGTFLLRAHQFLNESQGLKHKELLPNLWGFDISPFAAELSVINLYRQDMNITESFPRILSGDYFARSVGDDVEFPPARAGVQTKVKSQIPEFDVVVANPPYLRSQNQDDLDPKYRNLLFSVVFKELEIEAPAKTDLFAFFVYHSAGFIRPGGRIGFVTSASWLTADYGYQMQRFLLEELSLIAVIASDVESFFSTVEQNTVLFVARKRLKDERPNADETIRFVSLKKKLGELFPDRSDRWGEVTRLADEIESAARDVENKRYQIRTVPLVEELEALRTNAGNPRNWSINLRAPKAYFDLVEGEPERITRLGDVADCHLGYKSLQNQFFYMDQETIDSYAIEDRYIRPLIRLRECRLDAYVQKPKPSTFVFLCKDSEEDLRGTGALKYVRSMADRPATSRRQSDRQLTIAETLKRQSGGLWYAPKAVPNQANLWVRKAFGEIYSPFVFETPQVLDQRCNYLNPKGALSWQAIAAVLSSSVFALAVEAAGSASLGGGALEMPTRKLREVSVPDIRKMTEEELSTLEALAEAVWDKTQPIAWTDDSLDIPNELKRLDEFLLEFVGSTVSTQDLYKAIRRSVGIRIQLGRSRVKVQRKSQSANVKSVAEHIVASHRAAIESVQFPETLIPTKAERLSIDIDPAFKLAAHLGPLMTNSELRVETLDGIEVLNKVLDKPIAEILLRALLLGRRRFAIATDPSVAQGVLTGFWEWLPPLMQRIKAECSATSLGSRFEGEVFDQALKVLGWSQRVTEEELFGDFRIPDASGRD